eukprot:16430868-Heterocapsa_arctica.AAC.1
MSGSGAELLGSGASARPMKASWPLLLASLSPPIAATDCRTVSRSSLVMPYCSRSPSEAGHCQCLTDDDGLQAALLGRAPAGGGLVAEEDDDRCKVRSALEVGEVR